MTTTPVLANRVRTALGWIDDNAHVLPGDWHMTVVAGGRVTLKWADPTCADYTRGLLERHFGDPNTAAHAFTEAWWPEEGARPELRVLGVTIRAGVA